MHWWKGIVCFGFFVIFSACLAFAGPIHDAIDSGDPELVRTILSQDKSNLESKDIRGLSPLNKAALAGRNDLVKFLVSEGALLTSGDNEESQPIHNAAFNGHKETLAILLESGASIDARDMNNMTPLLFAISSRHFDAAQYLVEKGADLNAVSRNGMTPIIYAIAFQQTELAEIMLDKGASLKRLKDMSMTPLHTAASYGNLELVKLFLEKGAMVDAENEQGQTPLMWCRNPNTAAVVEYLIEKGADVKHRDLHGGTCLQNVVQRGSIPIAQILIDNGADVNEANDNGFTPLCLAAFGTREMVQFLLMQGASPVPVGCKTHGAGSCCSSNAPSALEIAAREGKQDIVQLLVRNGAPVNSMNEDGQTPLYLAALNGYDGIVLALIEHGAFLNIKEKHFGRTELHAAAINGSHEAVKVLIENGADLNVRDNHGKKAVDYAFRFGFNTLAYTLLASGADDSSVRDNVLRKDYLQEEILSKEAVVWHLGHAGWAIKTENHFLIFDYFLEMDDMTVPQASLANGHINPAELRDQNVIVFASHIHGDHYHRDIFNWRNQVRNITYVLGFTPPLADVIGQEYTVLPPRQEKEIGDVVVRTIHSTDSGVGFLITVDGLNIFHAGDHAYGRPEMKSAFRKEISYIEGLKEPIDLAFFPIIGCGLGEPELVQEGVIYATEKLGPRVLIPQHAGNRMDRYALFADMVKKKKNIPVACATARGDRFYYKDGMADFSI